MRAFQSLRSQLLFLVLLTALPLVGLALFNVEQQRRIAAEGVNRVSVGLARLGVTMQVAQVREAQNVLRTLSRLTAVRWLQAPACDALLRDLYAEQPTYTLVGVLNKQGDLVCSSLPETPAVNYSDREWFQRVMQSQDFTIGAFVIGRASGKPALPLAYPVKDWEGKTVGVVFLGLDMNWLSSVFATLDLPAGSAVTVIDTRGVVMARYPQPEAWLGRQVADVPVVRLAMQSPTGGSAQAPGLEGQPKLYAYEPLRWEEQTWGYLLVGIPFEVVNAEAQRATRGYFLMIGIVLLASLGLAWLFGERRITRRVHRLLALLGRLTTGDFSVRSGAEAEGGGEFGRLAQAVDQMAEALQQRELARQQALEALRQGEARWRTYLEQANDLIFTLDAAGRITYANPATCQALGVSESEIIGRNPLGFVAREAREAAARALQQILSGGTVVQMELPLLRPDGSRMYVEIRGQTLLDGERIIGTVHIARDITERLRAEEQIRHQLQTIQSLYASAQRLAESLDTSVLAAEIVRVCVEVLGARMAWLGRAEPDGRVRPLRWFPPESSYVGQVQVRWDESAAGQGPTGTAIRSGRPQVVEAIATDDRMALWRDTALSQGFCTSAAFPLMTRGRTFGALSVYSDQPGFFTPERVEIFQAFAHQAAAALENARLLEETERRLRRLQALRRIDMAITGSLDTRVAFNVALDEITAHLGVDAACILAFDERTRTLKFVAGRGFRTPALQHTHLSLGQGFAGRAAAEQRTLFIEDLLKRTTDFLRSSHFAAEDFVSYLAVPLVAEGRIQGVLELFHRHPLTPDAEWMEFVEILAGQAAIALERSTLLSELQRSHQALLQAYDATIEGWSYALDLRDKETEGHTQRVTELTLRLARALGINGEALLHIRRGALLHDIGKMGVPDSILLKPGPLSEEEWAIMRRHPQMAYEMLSRIEYLQPALDIPYCHHEKWDGTGYPRGLKGEAIPLAARIFAVVDVWDALTSDRPYRPAWSRERALAYIKEQSGKHFDPRVVEAFLREIVGEET